MTKADIEKALKDLKPLLGKNGGEIFRELDGKYYLRVYSCNANSTETIRLVLQEKLDSLKVSNSMSLELEKSFETIDSIANNLLKHNSVNYDDIESVKNILRMAYYHNIKYKNLAEDMYKASKSLLSELWDDEHAYMSEEDFNKKYSEEINLITNYENATKESK